MGKSAMAELWTTAMFHIDDQESSQVAGKASFVGFPKPADAGDNKRPRLFISWGFAVSSSCEYKEEAFDWIAHATSGEALAEVAPMGDYPHANQCHE